MSVELDRISQSLDTVLRIDELNLSIVIFQIVIAIQIKMDTYFDDDKDIFYKIIVIGDTSVGKTNLIHVFDKGRRPLTVNPTIGSQFTSKSVKLENGHKIKAQIWDTAGQEQFRAVTMSHYRGAVGALIVFDLTNRNSFDHVKEWLGAVIQKAQAQVQVGIIGNKADSNKRAVSKSEAEKFAKKHNLFYMETSADDTESVRSAFMHLFERVKETRRREVKGTNIKLQEQNSESGCKC